ncbi:MAG: ATP-dependent DNA helicase RecG [Bacilli bacterium]|nr:ATP-dependent DNA helicase RecG [Bacilli bacterium]
MPLSKSAKINELLTRMGIYSASQVVAHYPRRYDDFTPSDPGILLHLQDKQRIVIEGQVISAPKNMFFRKVSKTTFYFRSGRLDFVVTVWNQPYYARTLIQNETYTLEASYDAKSHGLNLLQMKRGILPPEDRIVPLYTLPREYPQHLFRNLVAKSLGELKGKIYDVIPSSLRQKYRLIPKEEAVRHIHFPADREDLRQGQRVLKYEEALLFSLKNQLIRLQNKALVREKVAKVNREKIRGFVSSLPYSLTNSQKEAVAEILKDLDANTLMYRLLQGDVGMGKTLVAFLAMYGVYTKGEQSALMAPTDALAKQHYKNIVSFFEGTGVTCALLTGSMLPKERKAVLSGLRDGSIDVVVGTHALFSQDVEYASLSLAVIDEQHKFGVNQRAVLAAKGDHCDLLLMSATPIPRTLAMTIYGDLDVSTLTEFPAKARKIKTKIVKTKDSCVDQAIFNSLQNGGRVYVVAPQIEEGEDAQSSVLSLSRSYEKRFPGKVALLHGKLAEEEKEIALASFYGGLRPILVSTSVIEVGIDVKEADTMIIHDPTHFALSSLHQLRGRIGRNGQSAICYLLYDGKDEEDLEKLRILVDYEDGFKIAEEDLRLRGPGEMVGVKQSGLPSLEMANLIADFKMFEAARDDATMILSHPEEKEFQSILRLAQKGLGEFIP